MGKSRVMASQARIDRLLPIAYSLLPIPQTGRRNFVRLTLFVVIFR